MKSAGNHSGRKLDQMLWGNYWRPLEKGASSKSFLILRGTRLRVTARKEWVCSLRPGRHCGSQFHPQWRKYCCVQRRQNCRSADWSLIPNKSWLTRVRRAAELSPTTGHQMFALWCDATPQWKRSSTTKGSSHLFLSCHILFLHTAEQREMNSEVDWVIHFFLLHPPISMSLLFWQHVGVETCC